MDMHTKTKEIIKEILTFYNNLNKLEKEKVKIIEISGNNGIKQTLTFSFEISGRVYCRADIKTNEKNKHVSTSLLDLNYIDNLNFYIPKVLNILENEKNLILRK